jgi:SAM-dependent methyltransferase
LPDDYFQNITCLSVLEHEVDIKCFAAEVSRLLKNGGKLYITFDYWEPKVNTSHITLYGLAWNIFDKTEVLALIEECEKTGLQLIEDVDWSLGDKVINENYYAPPKSETAYTFGMLAFEKKITINEDLKKNE